MGLKNKKSAFSAIFVMLLISCNPLNIDLSDTKGNFNEIVKSNSNELNNNYVSSTKEDNSTINGFTQKEVNLVKLINKYRTSKGLDNIDVSLDLMKVARIHVIDLQNNNPTNEICNLHSWSDKGNWSPCCYTGDHAKSDCMWNKPREISNYKGNGYEIAFASFGIEANPEDALVGWKNSSGHNSVIVNQDIWHNINWKSIGVGISNNYAVAWFGED